jgi:hypothetical protein
MLQDLQLAGHGERTQEAYLRAVRQLAAHTHLQPDQITEEQLGVSAPLAATRVAHPFPESPALRFAASANQTDYDHLRWLIALALGLLYILAAHKAAIDKIPQVVRCAECGRPMYVTAFLPPAYFDTS